MSNRNVVAMSLGTGSTCLLILLAYYGWQAYLGDFFATIILGVLVFIGLLVWLSVHAERAIYEGLLKEQSRLKRQLEEFHLKTEKLEFDANLAMEQKRSISRELQTKDRILLRLASVLEANMKQQQLGLVDIQSQCPGAATEPLSQRAEQMQKYAQDLTVLAAMDLPEERAENEVVHFDRQVDWAVEQLGPVIEQFDVTVQIENGEEQILIQTQPRHLDNLLIRVLETVIRLTHKDNVIVQLISYMDADLGESVRLTVTSGGRGLTEIEQQELFDQYFALQIDGVDISPGLSPAIAKRLSLQLGGSLTVQSVFQQQTQLTLILPLHVKLEGDQDAANS